jgi:hypothetical protein
LFLSDCVCQNLTIILVCGIFLSFTFEGNNDQSCPNYCSCSHSCNWDWFIIGC